MSKRIRVLYVDDYPLDRELVRDALVKEGRGCELIEAASREQFESLLGQGNYDVVLSDFNILGFEGLQVIAAVQRVNPGIPVVIVTGTGSEEVAVQALKKGAADYVIKSPQHIRHLPFTIANVLEAQRLQTERQRQADELKEAYRFLDLIVRTSPAALVVLDPDTHVRLWNGAAERIFGWKADQVRGQQIPGVPEGQRAQFDALIQTVMQGESHLQRESYGVRQDGTRVDVLFSAVPLRDRDETVAGVLVVYTDISERKDAERQLADSENQLRELTQHVNEVNESEKAQLARELHDHLGQHLTAVKLSLQRAGIEPVECEGGWAQRIESLVNLTDEAIQIVRETCMNLRPLSLDRLGLEAALRDEVARIRQIGQIAITLDCSVSLQTLDRDLAANLFRVVQESLTNILRHAGATKVAIVLKQWDDRLELSIRDNGIGIREETIDRKRSLGLVGMQERVRAYDGTFEIGPGPEGGTVVKVRIPRIGVTQG